MLKAKPHGPRPQGKQHSPQDAIKAHCRQCNGGAPDTCVCPGCSLHPYRMGLDSSGPKRSLMQAIQVHCLDCAGSVMGVRTCTATKLIDSQAPCALWSHREGGEDAAWPLMPSMRSTL